MVGMMAYCSAERMAAYWAAPSVLPKVACWVACLAERLVSHWADWMAAQTVGKTAVNLVACLASLMVGYLVVRSVAM